MELSFYIYGALTQIQLKMKKYMNIIFEKKILYCTIQYFFSHNLQDKAEIGLKVILIIIIFYFVSSSYEHFHRFRE